MKLALVAVVLLGLACAVLLGRLMALHRGMRRGREQIEAQLAGRTSVRLDIPCPDGAVEELFQSVNALLERRQTEWAGYREKERDLRRQIADVSHDLRTPLTSNMGYLQLLEREDLSPEERREYRDVVRRRCAALQELIAAFYDLSRIEGGAWRLERQPVDLSRELSDQLSAAYEQLERAGIRVEVDLEPGLPCVWGDRGAAARVLSNLLTNVCKHGSDHLKVRLYREGETVVSSFANAAPDMTADDVEKVFERFYTADRMRTGQNTGLGMAIVKALTERMGGQVWAELRDGEFTASVRWSACLR